MHGCCQLVLSSHSVTAPPLASLDLGPADLRDLTNTKMALDVN